MTGDRLALATRTIKAPPHIGLPSCRAPVLVGQQIARLTAPRAWIHIGCVPVVRGALTTDHPAASGGEVAKEGAP